MARYRRSQCSDDESEEDIRADKRPMWKMLICGRRRTVKSISTATQVNSLEIAQKWVDITPQRTDTEIGNLRNM